MHIFISYAKLDTRELALQLQGELRQLPNVTVWMDESIEIGKSWAAQIQSEIRKSDVVVVLLSPDVNRDPESESGQSFVINEIEYAQRQRKPIIPVMVQRIDMPIQIATLQYIDFTRNHATGTKSLVREIERRANMSLVTPTVDAVPPASSPMPVGVEFIPPAAAPLRSFRFRRYALIISALALLILVFAIVLLPTLNHPNPITTPVTNAALNPSAASASTQPKDTATLTITPTNAPTLTATPSLEIAFIVQTLDREATIEQATRDVQSTVAARATAYAVGTQNMINQTATATLWTATPTPNVTASIEAYRTQQAATATSQFFTDLTATATLWTATPTSTLTPTDTFTPSPTLTPTSIPLGAPGHPVTRNTDWTPQFQTFNGYEMALVPVGCFMMGSTDGQDDEKPVNQQCFDQPFWIDHYEVTNQQYGSEGTFKGANRPRDSVTWFQARDFCVQRGAQLPTEREWEYAARGPSNLVYPWGDDFVPDNVVYSNNSNNQAADVGSRPAGNSWVGASDLSGNVWEWVSSLYQPYPYDATDGRESSSDTSSKRVLHGGSSFFGESFDRASSRNGDFPTDALNNYGFRCVRLY